MNTEKREQIRQTLRRLVEAQASSIELLEKAIGLMNEELALDPVSFWMSRIQEPASFASGDVLRTEHEVFTVTFRGRSCFLGNTLPFRFFVRLARRPNAYVSYEELLTDVWGGPRSDDAVRSVAKALRSRFRQAGMNELAESIDGSVTGHYCLNLPE